MTRASACLVLLAWALGCLPSAAAGGRGPGRVEIGLDGGYADADRVVGDDGRLVALRVGYRFTHWLALEGQLEGVFPDCSPDSCPDLRLLLVNGLYNWRAGGWLEPYALFGVGYTDFEDDDAALTLPGIEDPLRGQAAFRTALGSRFYFGRRRRAAARLELSRTWLEDTSHTSAQVGVLWRIGRGL